ncbi:MAG: hypothetical protein CMB48_03225 [Euryarchaeota archaeon]|nr:hypothetical protein [Euryarchaeota archaeon]
MNQLLPYRHKSKLFENLDLLPLPNNSPWNGSIIYLDRDGVLNIGSENYINSPEELVILPDVANSIAKLKKNGFRLCIVTNQSPINRGYWGHNMLEKIHEKLISDLKKINEDAVVDLILYSPYAPFENSISRKPNPGMLMAGNVIINHSEKGEKIPNYVDLNSDYLFYEGESSAIVGDRLVDIQAGNSHGIRTFLVDPDIGLPQVIERILDKTDKGDVLQ